MGEAAFGLMDRVVEPVGDTAPGLITRQLDRTHYEPTWRAMQAFTASRSAATPDELWLTEHWPVFTLGLAGRAEHLLRDIGIPLVRSDRGGQITYHGPGQVVAYVLIDLARRRLKVRELVCLLEQSVIDLLAGYGVAGSRRSGAPGVYVGEAKIAALGLRVRSGCSYHGLSLNVDGDLEPFAAINPCGYEGLATTSLRNLGVDATFERARDALGDRLRELIATDRRTCCG